MMRRSVCFRVGYKCVEGSAVCTRKSQNAVFYKQLL